MKFLKRIAPRPLQQYRPSGRINTFLTTGMHYVKYVRSKRATKICLRLDQKDRIFVLTIPAKCSLTKAEEFALKHLEWMEEKLAELPERILFDNGAVIPILGEDVRIRVCLDITLKTTTIELKNNKLTVHTNQMNPGPRIERFLKKYAKEKLSELSYKKAERAGKTIKKITVRDTKSRWGSCSADRCLSYSWRLIFASAEAFDYVVAHEVAHLRYMNHGKNFWALCAELSRSYKKGRDWMRDHSHELMRYG